MAQSIVGTSLATTAVAAHRTVWYKLQVGWGVTTWPTNWDAQTTNETERMLSVSWNRDLSGDTLGVGSGSAAQMSVTLDNRDQRFSPYNTTGPLYSLLSATATTTEGTSVRYPKLYHVPVRLQMGFGASGTESQVLSATGAELLANDADAILLSDSTSPEFITVFSGYIDNNSEETYGLDGDRVTFSVLDRSAILLQRKASTTIRQNWRADQWVQYLVATLGGIGSGSYARGLVALPYVWLDDENIWDETQAVAAAEAGYFFFDELGIPQFKNSHWWLTDSNSTTSQFTFTTARLANFAPTYEWRAMSTGAIVEYQPRLNGGKMDLYNHSEPVIVPVAGTSFLAKLSYPALDIFAPTTPDDWLPVSASGEDLSATVTCALSATNAQRCTVTFTNNSGQTAFVPTFKLRGNALVGTPNLEVERTPTPQLLPYSKVQRYSGNAYLQTKMQADMLALLYADRMHYPRVMHNLRGVRAIPWLQLGDRVTISASEPFTSNRDAIITGLSFSYEVGGSFLMDVTAVDAAGLFEYSNFFIIGTSKYGCTDVSGYGRAYV